MRREAVLAGLIVASLIVLGGIVTLLTTGIGTAARAPAHLTEGAVVATREPDGGLQVAVVGSGSSAQFGVCDRLVAHTQVTDDVYIVSLRRTVLAWSCNDDAIPVLVRLHVDAATAQHLRAVEVHQAGTLIGYETLDSTS